MSEVTTEQCQAAMRAAGRQMAQIKGCPLPVVGLLVAMDAEARVQFLYWSLGLLLYPKNEGTFTLN